MIPQDKIDLKTGLGFPKGESLTRDIVHIALEFVEEIGFHRLPVLRGPSTVLPFLQGGYDADIKK